MKLLPDGRYEITNKKTGERKIVSEQELSSYGLSPQAPKESGNLLSKENIVGSIPDIAAFGGSMLPGPAGIAGGAMGGGIGTLLKNLLTNKPFENLTTPARQRIETAAPNLPQGAKDILTPLSIAPQDVFGTTKGTAPIEKIFGATPENPANPEFLVNTGKGAAMGTLGMLTGKATQAAAGSLSKIPLSKFLRPKVLQEGLGEAMEKTGRVLDDALTSTTGKIQVEPIVTKLEGIAKDAFDKGVPEAVKRVQKVAERLTSQGKEITAKQAQQLSSGFWQDIYGEAGKELTKRGVTGIAEKKAKQTAAGELSSATKEVLQKEGLTDGVSAYKLFRKLGILSKEMEQPFKNWWLGGLVGTLASATGGGIPAGAVTTLLVMPYTRLALRKIFSEMFTAGGTIGKGAIIKSVNDLFKEKE